MAIFYKKLNIKKKMKNKKIKTIIKMVPWRTKLKPIQRRRIKVKYKIVELEDFSVKFITSFSINRKLKL